MYNINDEGEITDNTIEINYNSNIPNGRIWIKKKVISFWNFSGSVSIFLFDLKTQLIRHKIVDKTFSFDEEWLVERPITQIDSINTKYEFIPLSKFDGIVGDTKKDYILHNMKADKKRKELIKRGYKTKKLSNSISDAEYKHNSTRYKFTESFSKFNLR
jgi:hypothetical protein